MERAYKYFSQEEDLYLRDNYLEMLPREMGAKLGRSTASIHTRMRRLGLRIPKEIVKKRCKGHLNGIEYRFKKGHTPANKGKKLSPEMYEKLRPTMFQKGAVPHNTKHNGCERITKDGYTEVRLDVCDWRLKHRVIWEQHNGSIPKGYVIKFRDGDKTNFDINNLMMVSKSENMAANTIHRYPDEVKRGIRLIGSLNREITKANREQDNQD